VVEVEVVFAVLEVALVVLPELADEVVPVPVVPVKVEPIGPILMFE